MGNADDWSIDTTWTIANNTNDVTVDENGDYFIISIDDGDSAVYEVGTWTEVNKYTIGSGNGVGSGGISAAAGLVCVPDDPNSEYDFYEYENWSTEWANAAITNIRSVYAETAFGPDGNYFAYWNGNHDIEIRSIDGDTTWATQATISSGNTNDKRALSWNHANGYILGGDRQGNVWLIEAGTWNQVDSLTSTDTGGIDLYSIEEHPSKPWFIAGDASGGAVTIFDASNGTLTILHQEPADKTGMSHAVAMNEKFFYHSADASDDYVHLADNDTWAQEARVNINDTLVRADMTPNGEWLLTGGWDSNTVYVVDADPGGVDVTGTVTLDGNAVSGAQVIGINDTQGVVEDTDTTDSNGDYTLVMTAGDTVHVKVQYDDGSGNQYNDESKPFVVA